MEDKKPTTSKRGRPARAAKPAKEETLVDDVNDIIENEPTINAKEVEGKITPLSAEDAEQTQETSNAETLDDKQVVLNFEDMRKRLKLPVLPSPAEGALVKLAVVTGMEKQEKRDIQLLLMFAEWRDKSYSNEKKYYAVMNGPNAPYVKEYAQRKGRIFQPVNIYWQHGARARQLAYEHLISQLDKNSVLIILYGRQDAYLRYLKGIADRRGIPVVYISNKELNHGV